MKKALIEMSKAFATGAGWGIGFLIGVAIVKYIL